MAGPSPEKTKSGEASGAEPWKGGDISEKVVREQLLVAQTDKIQIAKPTDQSALATAPTPMPHQVTQRELDSFRQQHPDMAPKDILALHESINKNGTDPVASLTDAVKKNRVVGYGDIHIEPSPHNDLLIGSLPQMKAAGATHFAVEMHTYMKPMLDQLQKDGRLSDSNKRLIRSQYKHPDAFIDILESAQKAGLNVVAVDSDLNDKRDRNTAMADHIQDILKADGKNKVVFFVGAEHLLNGKDLVGEKTAATHLRERNVPLSTFYPGLTSGDMRPISESASHAVSFNTRSDPKLGSLEISKDVKLATMTLRGETAKDYDNVIVFPAKTGTDAVIKELNTVGGSPEKALLAAVESNQVIGMGSLDWTVPFRRPGTDPQMKLLEDMLPQLKAKGITHIAADLPTSRTTGPLASLATTGKVNMRFLPYEINQFENPQYASLLEKAHALGIKVVPVGEETGYVKGTLHHAIVADNVNKILQQPGQHNKILLITKSSGLENHAQNMLPGKTIADRLRETGTKLATFSSVVEDGNEALPLVTERVKQPVAVQTREAQKTASIHNTNEVRLKTFDQLIVYPNHTAASERVIYPPR